MIPDESLVLTKLYRALYWGAWSPEEWKGWDE